eukprot:scaffold4213_cov201-Ochromonas_danica.AAC.8
MSADILLARYNEEKKGALLLFAWHALNVPTAQAAQLTHLDNEGFRLSIRTSSSSSSQHSVERVHLFHGGKKSPTSPLPPTSSSSLSLEDRLHALFLKYENARFPPQGSHSINLWLLLILSSIPRDRLPFFLHSLQALVYYVTQNESISLTLLLITLTLHILEAVYVLVLLRGGKVFSSTTAWLSWGAAAFVFGYPLTTRALSLSSQISSSPSTLKKSS